MTEEDFYQQILAHLGETDPLLVFADWLDERLDPRGELIRLNCAIEKCGGDDKMEWRRKQIAAKWTAANILASDSEWVDHAMRSLPDNIRRVFDCDCVERLLRIYEQAHPCDRRPRLAIETTRRYIVGEVSQDELTAARVAAWDARGEALRAIPEREAGEAAFIAGINIMKAAFAAGCIAKSAGWSDAAQYAAQAVWHGDRDTEDDSMDVERRWQVGRLCEYLAFGQCLSPIAQ